MYRIRYKERRIHNNNHINKKNEISNKYITNMKTFNGEKETKGKEDINKGKDILPNEYKKRVIDYNNKNSNKNNKDNKLDFINKNNEGYKIDNTLIENTFKLFENNPNKKYKITRFYPGNKFLLNIWKLTIIGPKDSLYYGREYDFKLDFSIPFKNITDNITIEKGIYHINFSEYGMLYFDLKYNENDSFYNSLRYLFDFLYNLFIEPNCEISKNFSRPKIQLYEKKREEYNKKVKDSLKAMNEKKKFKNLNNN
jgi:ubiquitin-protein ligase